MFICPFCMKRHEDTVKSCPDKNIPIPSVYIDDLKNSTPAVFVFTIGYSGHGKTCFLSSFLHSLYHGAILKKWPGFSFMGLNMDTLNKIHNEYVNILEQGKLPAKTAIMFPTPLILKFQNVPLKVKGIRRIIKRSKMEQKDLIFVFYDIGGGTFEVDEKIKQNLPILGEINTLVFLIDLPGIIKDSIDGSSAVQKMDYLLGTVYLAIKELGQAKEKNIVLCFTKADIMWGKKEIYGPLSARWKYGTPSVNELHEYFDKMKERSDSISNYIYENYTLFHSNLHNNFKSVCFTSLSSLGSQPNGNEIPMLSPTQVIDPILWTLKLERYL